MKQIKTIMKRADDWVQFDAEVNKAIAEGWTLVKRDVLRPYEGPTRIFHRMLYAELEKTIFDHRCISCKHFDDISDTRPCVNCDHNFSKWEPEV